MKNKHVPIYLHRKILIEYQQIKSLLETICMKFQPQNRFKVPVGTKFYRVKAKPWRPDSGARGTSSTAST